MSDVEIRIEGAAGRITLNRPDALNAITYAMLGRIETALETWREDDRVRLVVIDAAGDRAFCAGGDIADMYTTARAGDFAYGRRFWADEYRLNAKVAEYPKPYVAFMHGYTMGGGVGVSCHGSHRIVGDSSRISMPECGIGLVPDVGGSWLLARAPGRIGDYLGTTGARMGPGDAIFAGFADTYIPEARWPALIAEIARSGSLAPLAAAAAPVPEARLAADREVIDACFASGSLAEIARALEAAEGDFAARARSALAGVSPLAAAVTIALIDRVRAARDVRAALELEYRATWRAAEEGDFIEGIRAAIIDKDRAPNWSIADLDAVPEARVAAMLAPIPGRIEFGGPPK